MKEKNVAAFLVCGEKKGITAAQAKYLILGATPYMGKTLRPPLSFCEGAGYCFFI